MSSATLRIRARNASKEFMVHGSQLTSASLVRRLLTPASSNGRRLRALEGVNFEIFDGDMVGVIGSNGAGKSTLLRLIAGIMRPTSGSIEVHGEVTLLSGLGVGMLDDLTVHENIYLYGAICRLRRERIQELFDEIVTWAELGDFIGSPLRNLSTGMHSRLSFSIAKHVETPIILMDEALTAGDARFKGRCEAFFERRRRGPGSVVVASHSLEFVKRFCTKALWLRPGEQALFGDTDTVVDAYEEWAG